MAEGTIRVNGRELVVRELNKRLLDYLREDLKLTGTKEGCGIGRCGVCTVLVDGHPKRSCRVRVGEVVGRDVLTIEGLGSVERPHPVQQAFADAGAVQCGFCTPGMVLTAKALLDRNPCPSEAEIKRALAGNLCRCTGYVKIIEAVKLASRYIQEPPGERRYPDRCSRADALAKATGQAVFAADFCLPGTLFVAVARSPHPHARIKRIDLADALATPGVVDAWTAADVPGRNTYRRQVEDQPVVAGEVVRYAGEPVAVVVGESKAAAAEGAARVRVDYEVLPAVTNPFDALAPGAPALHPRGNLLDEKVIIKGDVAEALAQAEVTVSASFRTPAVEHAYLEPEAGVAYYDATGQIVIYGPTQAPHHTQREVAKFLGVSPEKVRIRQSVIGGAFGGKIDLSVHCLLALSLVRTGRPVKMVYSREESFQATTKRHPFFIDCTLGANRDGRLTAVKVDMVADTGAYASTGPGVLTRAVVHATGPYVVPNVYIRGRLVYTNNPISGAMRGYGAPQVALAVETLMDALAEKLGMDPLTLRELNAVYPGCRTATGQELGPDVGFHQTLEAIRAERERWRRETAGQPTPPHIRRGIGCASFWFGIGRTNAPNIAEARVELIPGGSFKIYVGATEIGQGAVLAFAKMAARALGNQPVENFEVLTGDSHLCPDADTTSASRQTYVSGYALLDACKHLADQIVQVAASKLGARPEDLELAPGLVRDRKSGRVLSLAEIADTVLVGHGRYKAETTHLGASAEAVPYEIYSYGTQMAEVEVNLASGEVKVLRVASAHDSGNIVDRWAAEGQVEGGVLMGLGYALLEKFIPGETTNFDTYHIPRTIHMPRVKSIFVTGPQPSGPLGAKGLGECSLVAVAPAILNAIYRACGVRLYEVPALPGLVLDSLGQREMPV